MSARSVVSSKFQVTIPKEVREELEVAEGETLSFVVEGERMHIVRIPKDIIGAMKNLLGGKRFPGAREEIMKDRKQW